MGISRQRRINSKRIVPQSAMSEIGGVALRAIAAGFSKESSELGSVQPNATPSTTMNSIFQDRRRMRSLILFTVTEPAPVRRYRRLSLAFVRAVAAEC